MDNVSMQYRVLVLGKALGELYRGKARAGCDLRTLRGDAQARRFDLVPPDGKWPGSNKEARELAEAQTYASDQVLNGIEHEIESIESEIDLFQSDIDAAEAERRSLEWAIRCDLVAVIGGRELSGRASPDLGAFDDAAQAEVDRLADDRLYAEAGRRADADAMTAEEAEIYGRSERLEDVSEAEAVRAYADAFNSEPDDIPF